MRLKFAVYIFFISLLGFSSLTYSDTSDTKDYPSNVKVLIQAKKRPTPLDLLDAFNGKLPSQNPFVNVGDTLETQRLENLREKIFRNIPEALAVLESGMPGAIVSPLGRDAVITGDIFDTLFSLNGQKGRVIRTDLSTGSFTNLSEKQLLGYLNSIGFNPKKLIQDKQPVLFMDRTSYSSASQSRKLMRALYRQANRQGIKSEELGRFLQFASLIDKNGLNRNLELKSRIQELKAGDFAPEPTQSVLLPGITDTLPWHDSWKKPTNPSGKRWYARPGKNHPQFHQQILAEFYEVLSLLHSRPFWEEVARAFKRYDLSVRSFPLFERFQAEIAEREKEQIREAVLNVEDLAEKAPLLALEKAAEYEKTLLNFVLPAPLKRRLKEISKEKPRYLLDVARTQIEALVELFSKADENGLNNSKLFKDFLRDFIIDADKNFGASERDHKTLTKEILPEFLKKGLEALRKNPILSWTVYSDPSCTWKEVYSRWIVWWTFAILPPSSETKKAFFEILKTDSDLHKDLLRTDSIQRYFSHYELTSVPFVVGIDRKAPSFLPVLPFIQKTLNSPKKAAKSSSQKARRVR